MGPNNAREAGMVSGTGMNNPRAFNNEGYNTFDRSSVLFDTQRFAEINPVYMGKFISGDHVKMRSSHELRTYTLASPLMSRLYMHRAYFAVPLQAIYPHTFKPFFTIPNHGNDLPTNALPYFNLASFTTLNNGATSDSLVNTLLTHLPKDGNTIAADSYLFFNNASATKTYNQSYFATALGLLLNVFSRDSILSKLGYGIHTTIDPNNFNKYSVQDVNVTQQLQNFYKDNIRSIDDLMKVLLTFEIDVTVSSTQEHLKGGFMVNDRACFPIKYSISQANTRYPSVETNGEVTLSEARQRLLDLLNNKLDIISDVNNSSFTAGADFVSFGVFAEGQDGYTPASQTAYELYCNAFFALVKNVLSNLVGFFPSQAPQFAERYAQGFNINMESVVAYQLICAQFYTNPYIDDIDSADLWLNNQYSLMVHLFDTSSYSGNNVIQGFLLNGVRYEYDVISNGFIHLLMSIVNGEPGYNRFPKGVYAIAVMSNFFERHDSLKLSDYFTQARLEPLAVGDVTAPVVGNLVSAVDINRSLWMQRLLNAANRIPQTVTDYIRQMFGTDPVQDHVQPRLISQERFSLGNQEIENTTSQDPGNVVTLLRGGSSYQFETSFKEPTIVIGLSSYSAEYSYIDNALRVFSELNRYENFNPYLQHVGDQPVFTWEISNRRNTLGTPYFGYMVRYAQYKYGINRSVSAFADGKLPSWNMQFNKHGSDDSFFWIQGPHFLRNRNEELDSFYSSLTGTTYTEYFHFIARFDTSVLVNSKQQKSPSLI